MQLQPKIPAGTVPLFYSVVIDQTTAIAAGASATITQKIDSASTFYVQSLAMSVSTPAVVLTSTIAGTPYPREAVTSPGTTGNSFPSLAHFRVQIQTALVQWFSLPARCNLVCGDGQLPAYLGVVRGIGVGQDVQVTIYNDTAGFTAAAQIILTGYKLVPPGSAGLGT